MPRSGRVMKFYKTPNNGCKFLVLSNKFRSTVFYSEMGRRKDVTMSNISSPVEPGNGSCVREHSWSHGHRGQLGHPETQTLFSVGLRGSLSLLRLV